MTTNSLSNPAKTQKEKNDHTIWLISPQKAPDINSAELEISHDADVIEYSISELALYMLNPDPIEVSNTLVGCKIVYKKPTSVKIKDSVGRLFRGIFPPKSGNAPEGTYEETVYSDCTTRVQAMEDASLQRHIDSVKGLLKPYDSLIEKLSELAPDSLADIVSVFEDPEGNRTFANLKGTIAEKILYITDHIQEKAGVILKRSYVGDGLFEMRGFDFTAYRPEKSFRLMVVTRENRSDAFVLSPTGSLIFKVQDPYILKYLKFLQLSLKTNLQLEDLFHQCAAGVITPLKLFFKNNPEIDYFKTDLPKIYREFLQAENITPNVKDVVVTALNQRQIGIVMVYLPKPKHGRHTPITDLYVMHDVKALEPVKSILPQLYDEIDQKKGTFECGQFYLMDSVKGYNNAK